MAGSASRMLSAPFSWQQKQWDLLTGAAAADRLHHALLLTGPAGTGKAHFAQALAKALLCEHFAADRRACGSCSRCALLDGQTHPDFTELRWIDKATTISIDQIRRLSASLALTTTYGPWRIAIIHAAHSLTGPAANSLLKTLEEPPPGCLLILVVDREASLPVTVRSRCQRVVMPLPSKAQSLAWLEASELSHPESALACARGAPLSALALAGQESLAAVEKLRSDWRDFLLGKVDVVLMAEAAARQLTTRECLTLFSEWTVDIVRGAESAAIPASSPARRLYFSEVCRILAAVMRLDNSSLKTQAVIEGVLADIKNTRTRIRAENPP